MTANSSVFTRVPPHQVIKGAFGQEMADSLVSYAVLNQARFEKTSVKRADGEGPDPSFRVSSNLREWRPMRIEVKRRMRELFPALLSEVGSPPFELYTIELELVAHGDGAFFGRHIDTYTGLVADVGYQRVLSAVYYFHFQPKAFSGGALRLFALAAPAGKDVEFLDIEPEHDTLVVFPSWVPHEVRMVSCPSGSFVDSRFAINCWFCRKAESTP
jgi:SM-20-related protein